MSELAEALEELADSNIFIAVEGTVSKRLVVIGGNKRLQMDLSNDERQLAEQLGEIDFYINNPNKVLIGWDLKNLFSHVRNVIGIKYDLDSNLLDLKVLEAFCGIFEKHPESFKAAQTRLLKITQGENWDKLKYIYKNIHLPLITNVIPDIENAGIIHTKNRLKLNSYYEILGQINGRSKCSKISDKSFNPHSINESDREILRPAGFDEVFMYIDFHHQEVSVLQWLSKDPELGKTLETGEDLYNAIWKDITTLEPTPDSRKICKGIFLPVIFGQGAKSLSERLKIPFDIAQKLITKIQNKYSVAVEYVAKQMVGEDGFALDYYGKKRFFGEQDFKIRNFAIQSPASTICLHKLVRLHREIKDARIAMHIHDGYVFYVRPSECRKVYNLSKDILESDDDSLYPDLKLKISCEVGPSLNNLKPII